ncbi:MAG: 6-phosphofructokinase [Flavipsychrobacter sp.]|nr:6-phosphofructokinase [Flavipsychrobacter sp.]
MKRYKTIAVMTSGGDAPGMNAAIRAVVRTAANNGLKTFAVHDGFEGIIDGDFMEIDATSVSNIIQRGGTIIHTSRSERFLTKKWRLMAYEQLIAKEIDAVFIIGGNGSFKGANVFTSEFDIPFVGIPKTIDNDVYGTDHTIGFDTACNTAMEAIDKIRDTANSHHRLFIVEVMGRDFGFIAAQCGISSGVEAIMVPEIDTGFDDLIAKLERGWVRQKQSLIVIVAEGCHKDGVTALAEQMKARFNYYDIRVCVLGHMQRGGSPSSFDRVLASRLGYEGVLALLKGKKNIMVGMKNGKLNYVTFADVCSGTISIDKQLLLMADVLAS